jgi:hypothetical protein
MLALNAGNRPQSVDQVLPLLEPSLPNAHGHASAANGNDEGFGWAPDVLRALETSLETHLGPISRALVRKAARRTTNLESLTSLVAQLLPSERERTEFLARTRQLLPPPAPRSTPSGSAGRRAGADLPLDETLVARAERVLAARLGPMALVIVRKTAQQTNDPAEFHRRLAAELDNEAERGAFLQAVTRAES